MRFLELKFHNFAIVGFNDYSHFRGFYQRTLNKIRYLLPNHLLSHYYGDIIKRYDSLAYFSVLIHTEWSEYSLYNDIFTYLRRKGLIKGKFINFSHLKTILNSFKQHNGSKLFHIPRYFTVTRVSPPTKVFIDPASMKAATSARLQPRLPSAINIPNISGGPFYGPLLIESVLPQPSQPLRLMASTNISKQMSSNMSIEEMMAARSVDLALSGVTQTRESMNSFKPTVPVGDTPSTTGGGRERNLQILRDANRSVQEIIAYHRGK